MQLLIHPYSWTDEGYDSDDNFKMLLAERSDELIETISSECRHFTGLSHG